MAAGIADHIWTLTDIAPPARLMLWFGALRILIGILAWYSAEGIARFWTDNPRALRLLILASRVAADGLPMAIGGTEIILDPWDLEAGRLDAVGYRYTLPEPDVSDSSTVMR
jgi:hypothetical protein